MIAWRRPTLECEIHPLKIGGATVLHFGVAVGAVLRSVKDDFNPDNTVTRGETWVRSGLSFGNSHRQYGVVLFGESIINAKFFLDGTLNCKLCALVGGDLFTKTRAYRSLLDVAVCMHTLSFDKALPPSVRMFVVDVQSNGAHGANQSAHFHRYGRLAALDFIKQVGDRFGVGVVAPRVVRHIVLAEEGAE